MAHFHPILFPMLALLIFLSSMPACQKVTAAGRNLKADTSNIPPKFGFPELKYAEGLPDMPPGYGFPELAPGIGSGPPAVPNNHGKDETFDIPPDYGFPELAPRFPPLPFLPPWIGSGPKLRVGPRIPGMRPDTGR